MINPLDNDLNQHLKPQNHADNHALCPRIRSEQLFTTQNEIIIEHQGNEYRLRITSNDKLILTK